MIPIAEHIKNIERMHVHKDGNAYFVAFDDFVDLQASPAFFIGEEYGGHILRVMQEWYGCGDPLVHLTHEERAYLARKLTQADAPLFAGVAVMEGI